VPVIDIDTIVIEYLAGFVDKGLSRCLNTKYDRNLMHIICNCPSGINVIKFEDLKEVGTFSFEGFLDDSPTSLAIHIRLAQEPTRVFVDEERFLDLRVEYLMDTGDAT
jgi:hypothetical protein